MTPTHRIAAAIAGVLLALGLVTTASHADRGTVGNDFRERTTTTTTEALPSELCGWYFDEVRPPDDVDRAQYVVACANDGELVDQIRRLLEQTP